MLQTIDVLIGFTVVMLILSAIVTLLVQFVSATLLNLKGMVLKDGVAHLLGLLDKNNLTELETRKIADHVLRDSLIAKKMLFFKKWRLAGVVHREELTKLILDFAGGADLTKADAMAKGEPHNLEGEARLRARLLNSLRANGIEDPPADILKSVRSTMLALEQSQPELATDVRQSLALLTHASSEFVAKLNAWFDQTIDRTIDVFAGRTRLLTLFFAAVVSIFFQVNSIDLMRRLSVDDETRRLLVDAAVNNPERFVALQPPEGSSPAAGGETAPPPPVVQPTAPKPEAAPQPNPTITPAEALKRIKNDPDLNQLVEAELISWPESGSKWLQYWSSSASFYDFLARLAGVLLTVGLLALGAPVWYELLKNLLHLRSIVARKDDGQRLVRQTSQEPVRASVAPPAAAGAAGEQGDLEAVG